MCGRFGSYLLPREIWRIFHTRSEPEDEPDWLPTWNLCPSQEASVVLGAGQDGAPRRWSCSDGGSSLGGQGSQRNAPTDRCPRRDWRKVWAKS